uniref:NADH:ubiquinone reductase (H(+)-translocating) n=2 Tax=Ishige okamurae TaxID=233772 RepID=A0A4Y5T7L0_9PHAE|nr:NADH dehydrogenase subunit 4L [Ishige okamurae]
MGIVSVQAFEYSLLFIIMLFIGVFGIVLNRTNILAILMSLEIGLLSISLNFLLFSVFLDDIIGQLFGILVISVAACESSVGLALILVYYRVRGSILLDKASLLRF